MSIVAAFMVPHPPMIVPAVGRGSEAQIEETTLAYQKVAEEIAALAPDTILISSPHQVMYKDYFHLSPGEGARGSFASFGAPEVSFSEEYDEPLVQRICQKADEASFPAGTLGEKDPALDHGTMVPLWFIRNQYKGGKIVRMGLSGCSLLDHYRFGELIREAVDELGRKAVFVASGDLSHKLQEYGPYGFAPEGTQYDKRIMDVCERAAFGELFDFDEDFCEKASECGHRSFVIMVGAFDKKSVKATVYSHQDVTGVGYGISSFYPTGEDESRRFREIYIEKKKKEAEERRRDEDAYVRLARASLESYILSRKIIEIPEDLPHEMREDRAGVFVSIHENGNLRGCIGTFLPLTGCIANEIITNAISASTRDLRFTPITENELPFLDISVDVLSEPEEIASVDELDVKRYGVIVSAGGKRGLLLPDLEGVDTVEEQIQIARNKAGILPTEEIQLQRFEVVRHGDK